MLAHTITKIVQKLLVTTKGSDYKCLLRRQLRYYNFCLILLQSHLIEVGILHRNERCRISAILCRPVTKKKVVLTKDAYFSVKITSYFINGSSKSPPWENAFNITITKSQNLLGVKSFLNIVKQFARSHTTALKFCRPAHLLNK